MRQVRIFVSSPGDVDHERRRVDRVIERINGEFAGVAQFASIRWETRFYQAHETFQAQIPAAAECDIVVAIFRARLGTELPPDFLRMPDGSPYPSGAAYEVLTAIAARREGNFPDVYVFRDPEPPMVRLDDLGAARVQQQWERLKAFFDNWFAAPEGPFNAAFHTFASADDFEGQLDRLLHQWLEDKVLHGRAALWPVETKGSPFRGLAAFGAKHASVFFGRSRDIARGVDQWKTAAQRGTPFLLVVGASGAGKSSLVRAGLVPRLTVPGVVPAVDVWRVAVMRPGETPGSPITSLANRLLDTEKHIPEEEVGRPPALPEIADHEHPSPAELASLFAHADATAVGPVRRALERVGEAEKARQGYSRPLRVDLVLVIDQLDELFGNDVAATERAQFARLLALFVETGRVWVVATLRADLYERFLTEPVLLTLKTGGAAYDLTSPGPAELAEIVQKPAEAAELVFETDPVTGERLDERLLHEADRADMLPLLQLALERLFADRVVVNGEDRLTNTAYMALDGLAGIIDREAERAVANLGEVELSGLPRLLRHLVGLSRLDSVQGAAPLAIRPAPHATAAPDEPSQRLVHALVEARILLSSGEGLETVIRLVHQRVLADWVRAREMIAASMDFYRIRDGVEEQRRRWQAAGRRGDLLIPRGLPLAEAECIAARFGDELLDEAGEYIIASGRRARVGQRLTAAAAVLFALLATGATGAGIIAWRERQQAVAEEQRAEAEKTRAEAEKIRAEAEKNRAESEKTRAESNLDAAKQAVDSLVFSIAQSLRDEGVRTQTMRKVLDRVKGPVERLSQNAPDDSQLLNSRAAMLDEFVDTYLAAGDLESARKSAEEALEVRRGLVKREAENEHWQHNLPISLDKIGDIRAQMNDAPGALAAYEEGLVIRRRLAEKDPGNEQWRRDVSASLDRIGDVKLRLGDADAAVAAYEEGLGIRRQLAQAVPGNLLRRRDLSVSLERIPM
jgi:tetratricopeptide (TPR) repeat protein